MAKLNKKDLKVAVETYATLIADNKDEAIELMTSDGLDELQIEQVIAECSEPKEEEKEAPKTSKIPKYGKFKVDVKYLYKEDSKGNRKAVLDEFGSHEFEIVQGELIREVIISEEQAEILNEQAINSKEGYYLIK